MNFTMLLSGTEGAENANNAGGGDILSSMLPILAMVLIIGVMYFVTIRPQRKRDKDLKAQISKMAVGDSVVTIGGIVGTIANIKDDEVTITTSVAHTMMTFKKSSISTIKKRESN